MANVWIAMSGGVDSTTCAYLLKRQGHVCTGVMLRLTDGEQTEHALSDAAKAAERMDIPFHIVDAREEFREQVIKPFLTSYEQGLTPNPCLDCNRRLKFGVLLKAALANGADFLATGHYARIGTANGRYVLKKASDLSKEQSYVLYALTQEQLAHVLFPLGELHKDEVRRLAAEAGMPNAAKAESQDICFIPDGDYAAFLERTAQKTYPPGNFTTRDGRVLGTHRGLIHYTVGQRKGLGLALPEPYYVCGKDAQRNRILLCPKDELFVRELTVREFHWLSVAPPDGPIRAQVRVRYHQAELPATLCPHTDGSVHIFFDERAAVASPGQAAVAYQGDVLLGGGRIV